MENSNKVFFEGESKGKEAREQRAARRRELNAMRISGIKFHVVRDYATSQMGGGLVVAERKVKGELEVAFSFCHNHDQFNKTEGKYLAGVRLLSGKGVKINADHRNIGLLATYFSEKTWG